MFTGVARGLGGGGCLIFFERDRTLFSYMDLSLNPSKSLLHRLYEVGPRVDCTKGDRIPPKSCINNYKANEVGYFGRTNSVLQHWNTRKKKSWDRWMSSARADYILSNVLLLQIKVLVLLQSRVLHSNVMNWERNNLNGIWAQDTLKSYVIGNNCKHVSILTFYVAILLRWWVSVCDNKPFAKVSKLLVVSIQKLVSLYVYLKKENFWFKRTKTMSNNGNAASVV